MSISLMVLLGQILTPVGYQPVRIQFQYAIALPKAVLMI